MIEPPQVESTKPEPAPPAKKLAKVIQVARRMTTVKPVFVNEEEPEDEERKLREIQRTLEEMAEKARQEEIMRLAAPQHATHRSQLSNQKSQIVPSNGMSAENLMARTKPPSVQISVKESLR